MCVRSMEARKKCWQRDKAVVENLMKLFSPHHEVCRENSHSFSKVIMQKKLSIMPQTEEGGRMQMDKLNT